MVLLLPELHPSAKQFSWLEERGILQAAADSDFPSDEQDDGGCQVLVQIDVHAVDDKDEEPPALHVEPVGAANTATESQGGRGRSRDSSRDRDSGGTMKKQQEHEEDTHIRRDRSCQENLHKGSD